MYRSSLMSTSTNFTICQWFRRSINHWGTTSRWSLKAQLLLIPALAGQGTHNIQPRITYHTNQTAGLYKYQQYELCVIILCSYRKKPLCSSADFAFQLFAQFCGLVLILALLVFRAERSHESTVNCTQTYMKMSCWELGRLKCLGWNSMEPDLVITLVF